MQPCSDLHLYDKLLPWLAGSPLEHLLATVAPSTGATQEWRSRQCAATDGWRYLTFTLRVLLLEVAQFTTSKAKLLKWHLRNKLLGDVEEVNLSFFSFSPSKIQYIIIVCYLTSTITLVSPWGWSGEKKHRHMREQLLSFASSDLAQAWELGCMRMG